MLVCERKTDDQVEGKGYSCSAVRGSAGRYELYGHEGGGFLDCLNEGGLSWLVRQGSALNSIALFISYTSITSTNCSPALLAGPPSWINDTPTEYSNRGID